MRKYYLFLVILRCQEVSFLLLKNIFTRNKILVLQYIVSPTPPYTHSLFFLLHILKMSFHSPRVCVISEEKSAVIPLFILLDIMYLFVSLIDFNFFFFFFLSFVPSNVNVIHWVLYSRGPQPPGCGPVSVWSLLGSGPHSRRCLLSDQQRQ